jgi:hypothetical protein
MKLEPTCVLSIWLSRKFLRICTSGASSEPNVAVAIRHFGAAADEVLDVLETLDVLELVELVKLLELLDVLVVLVVAAATICTTRLTE